MYYDIELKDILQANSDVIFSASNSESIIEFYQTDLYTYRFAWSLTDNDDEEIEQYDNRHIEEIVKEMAQDISDLSYNWELESYFGNESAFEEKPSETDSTFKYSSKYYDENKD